MAFGGYVKGTPLLREWFPADPTLLGIALLLSWCVCEVFRRRWRLPKEWAPIAILALAFTIGYRGGALNPYASQKMQSLVVLTLPCALGAVLVLGSARARRIWLALVVGLGALVAGLAIASPNEQAAINGRLAIEGGNTIGAGRATGAAVVVLVALALGGVRRRVLAGVAGAVTGVAMVGTGSRGPLLAAVISVLVVAILPKMRGRARRVLLGAIALVVSAYLALRADLVSNRLTTTADDSSAVRRSLWMRGVEVSGDHPLGIGWGNLHSYLNMGPGVFTGWRQYPHNLFLEVAVEASWLALTVLLAVMMISWRRQRMMAMTPVELAMLGLFVFAVISAMVSGDVNDNRGVWVAIGAALVAPFLLTREVQEESARST
ncbi:O-antigen ligase family protein [Knoellia sp. 3-2P3]|uniref:O-antigen ligase family protein n=1 Tax=unclassified Knoellia TaxID=2618719 RepID=UPI0023DC168E|nr:O-antigen ligase family protein [Knoellia sp. 3-2P3]MDF2094128.1 O-antigen ligase family protein [Knoellia sp. 3-2P3]